jgi:hypothetical protein
MKNVLKATLATLVSLVSCSNSPTGLVGQFKSYTPIAEVEEKLRREGYEWAEVERNETPASSSGDPFSFVRMKVDVYQLAEAPGELELSFFNSQLMRVIFYPELSQDFDRLQSTSGLDAQGSVRKGHVLVRRGEDHRRRSFLSWEDERLVDDMDDWLRQRG